MDLRKLKTLIDLVESSGIAEIEIQEGEERVRITRSHGPAAPLMVPAAAAGAAAAVPIASGPAQATASTPADEVADGEVIKSPMVGTFYRAADPSAKPFVEVGDTIQVGQAL